MNELDQPPSKNSGIIETKQVVEGKSRCFSVVDKITEKDYDLSEGWVNMPKANLVPLAKAKDYRVHWGKCEGISVKT